MGDMADYYIGLQLDQDWSPVGSRRQPNKPVSCKTCGSTAVHWALMDGGYKLVDDARGLHNRNVLHVCQHDDDFEVIPNDE